MITLRYRGAPLHSYLRPKLRLECFPTDAQSPVIINVLRGHAGSAGQVAVLELEEAASGSPGGTRLPDDPRLRPAVHYRGEPVRRSGEPAYPAMTAAVGYIQTRR